MYDDCPLENVFKFSSTETKVQKESARTCVLPCCGASKSMEQILKN